MLISKRYTLLQITTGNLLVIPTYSLHYVEVTRDNLIRYGKCTNAELEIIEIPDEH